MIDREDHAPGHDFGLKGSIISRMVEVLKRYPDVDEAILYGSRAKKTHRPGSDIDIVLKGESLNLKIINSISLELENLLLPYKFDLSIYHRISNPELIDHIKRVGQTIYKRT